MNKSDVNDFIDSIHSIGDNYNRAPLSRQTLAVWFEALREHSLETVQKAVAEHVTDPDQGRFFPTIAHLIAKIGVAAEVDAQFLLAEARMRSTPLGMRVLGHIPTSDFHALQEPVLLQRASQLLGRVDEWRSKHEQGDYTDGEVRQMVVSGVWPDAPFTSGENKPAHNESLKKQIERFCNNEDTPKIESDHPSGTVQSDYEGSRGKAAPMPDSVRQAFSVLLNNVKV